VADIEHSDAGEEFPGSKGLRQSWTGLEGWRCYRWRWKRFVVISSLWNLLAQESARLAFGMELGSWRPVLDSAGVLLRESPAHNSIAVEVPYHPSKSGAIVYLGALAAL
jgi:hypothetical protein